MNQDVYNAVIQSLKGFDAQALMERIASRFDISFAVENLRAQGADCLAELSAPSAIYNPKLFIDGDQWCALYGDNIQDGVAGFGKSPQKAIEAFNKAWSAELDKIEQ